MDVYEAPWWLPGPHVQTIVGALRLGRRVSYKRERWSTPDGDFIDVDWAGAEGAPQLLVLFHGLEGHSRSEYARSIAAHAVASDRWRFAVPHFRGCSGEPNLKARAYHAGDSEEIDWILRRFAASHASVHAAGVSLGANALLKWLGERGEEARHVVRRAAAISAPFRLTATGAALERGFSLIYAKYFLRYDLRYKALAKLRAFPDVFDEQRVRAAVTLRHFDDVVTAPLHGFCDVDDYWTRASAEPWLPKIRVPTLVLNARNDPFLPNDVLRTVELLRDGGNLPRELVLEFPETGGHAGFAGRKRWLAGRVLEFLSQP
jgi:predicted alpha/beta-fold hydrolase